MPQLRSQVICGMYGIDRAGEIAECWKEPMGMAAHTGLTPELAQKYILHSHKAINQFISDNRFIIKHMGPVGLWSDRNIESLVLPTAGDMEVDEVEELDNVGVDDVLGEELDD